MFSGQKTLYTDSGSWPRRGGDEWCFLVVFNDGQWSMIRRDVVPCQAIVLVVNSQLVLVVNVVKTTINHPFGNGLCHLFMVTWGMVYYCFTHTQSESRPFDRPKDDDSVRESVTFSARLSMSNGCLNMK